MTNSPRFGYADSANYPKEQQEQPKRTPINLTRILLDLLRPRVAVPFRQSRSQSAGVDHPEDGYAAPQRLRAVTEYVGGEIGEVDRSGNRPEHRRNSFRSRQARPAEMIEVKKRRRRFWERASKGTRRLACVGHGAGHHSQGGDAVSPATHFRNDGGAFPRCEHRAGFEQCPARGGDRLGASKNRLTGFLP